MIVLFFFGLGAMLLGFAVVWAIAERVKNYAFLDVAWSYGLALLAPFYALFGPGLTSRKIVFTALGVAWSLRLGTHILLRVLHHHPQEDPRYAKLRERWPGPGMFFLFFEFQALLIALLSWPFLLVAFNPAPTFSALEIFGLALGAVALIGETVADAQMEIFKKDPTNKNKVCQIGLWHYSRHPNYFFEALIWWAYFFVALDAPFGWATIFCPLLMIHFLLFVTGISLSEEFSLRSRGQAYRDYQRSTSPFIPWFPKKL